MAPTPRELLAKTTPWLTQRGIDGARLDAELLLAHATGLSRVQLYMDLDRPLSEAEVAAYREHVRRRGLREPVAYLVGEKEFWGLALHVDPQVLIPRPDTETLVEEALRLVPEGAAGTLVDVCTGSGCIALAILSERPGLRAVATDVSAGALAIAARNAARHGLTDRVALREGDLLAPCGDVRDALLVVANPPYIRKADAATLMRDVAGFEPALALYGLDDDGLGHHRRLLAGAAALLAPGGHLLLELGHDQGAGVLAAAHPGLDDGRVIRDLGGNPRVGVWARAAG